MVSVRDAKNKALFVRNFVTISKTAGDNLPAAKLRTHSHRIFTKRSHAPRVPIHATSRACTPFLCRIVSRETFTAYDEAHEKTGIARTQRGKGRKREGEVKGRNDTRRHEETGRAQDAGCLRPHGPEYESMNQERRPRERKRERGR